VAVSSCPRRDSGGALSEKLKPNFTPVPNVIFDEVMRTLAPGAVKILFAICRYTYGWGKKSDRISLNQLSEMTGMDRANVARSVRQLGHRVIVRPGDPRTNQASEYRINVDISDSDLVSKAQQGLVSQQHQASVRPSVKTPPIQRKTKERRKSTESDKLIPDSLSTKSKRKLTRPDPAQIRAFEAWYAAYPKHVGRKPALKAWLKLDPDPVLVETIMTATARYADLKAIIEARFVLDPATWINQERWTDETPIYNSNGHAKPVQVTDLGNGMLEVDGVQMDRRIYERRHGQHANA
jgi:phage replication O-like protein O